MKLISTPRKTATDAAARRAKAHAKQGELGEHTSLWSRSGFLVRRLHQIHVAMFKDELAAYHVTPVQYGLLSILVDMPGIDQFSLAEELGIDRANVHDVLKRLESRKLLIRVVDPHNRRRKLCLTTKQGAELVARHQTGMQKAQRRLLDPLTVAERATFLDLLLKLVNANNDFGRTVLSSSRSKPVRSSPPKVVPISHSKGER